MILVSARAPAPACAKLIPDCQLREGLRKGGGRGEPSWSALVDEAKEEQKGEKSREPKMKRKRGG